MPKSSVSVTHGRNGASTKANALGMRPIQERVYEKRGEQYLLIKSPPASDKSRAWFTNLVAAVDAVGHVVLFCTQQVRKTAAIIASAARVTVDEGNA
ncbi:hypothetical protein [Castellaniella caeni]|uniref:hypothetical protein n=1 Tax=Castellaniella caeni TaxID=266123 RepID=UPI000C9F82B7|nr:hypothetical protein [Castellaniella caeni]